MARETGGVEATRVDRWLWAVRIFPTRTASTDACKGGLVTVNDAAAKPSTTVKAGDRVEAQAHGRRRVLEVVTVIEKRVGAPVAATCLVDHSPPVVDPRDEIGLLVRDPGTGRPTKRDRRQLDRFRQREG